MACAPKFTDSKVLLGFAVAKMNVDFLDGS
jgi:hypothetical protein